MITPVVLAAGASRRMGRPKALLNFDGRTALDRVLEAFAGLGAPVVVLGAAAGKIAPRLPAGTRVVVNPDPDAGQTSSLKAGIRAVPPDAEGFLFHPVDFPLVRAGDVARLVDAFRASRASVVLPAFGFRRGHPVLCRPPVGSRILALPDRLPARVAVHADPGAILHVPVDGPYLLMDMDTPSDYARCLAAFRARRP